MEDVVDVGVDLEVLVAGHAERGGLDDTHAGEQLAQVRVDDLLDRDQPCAVVVDDEQPREQRWHLDAREVLGAAGLVAHDHGEVEREAGDVREGVRRVDRQWGEHRLHALGEQLTHPRHLVGAQVAPPDDGEPRVGELGREHVGEQPGVQGDQALGDLTDPREALARRRPGRAAGRDARRDPSVQGGDADHEELVEVAREDRGEPDPLEQRHVRVCGQLEDAGVEVQPAQLAVEEAVGGPLGCRRLRADLAVLQLLDAVVGVARWLEPAVLAPGRCGAHGHIVASRAAPGKGLGELGLVDRLEVVDSIHAERRPAWEPDASTGVTGARARRSPGGLGPPRRRCEGAVLRSPAR